MNSILLEPKKALNKAFLKIKPNRINIESFKTNLIQVLDAINEKESEEFHKNLVIEFLKKTYYDPNHFVNTKGRNDLVIHNGKDAKSNVGVIIEAKSPSNKTEMITTQNLNGKALQELVLYYMRERITHKNTELKHLVITNIYEWFVFDAHLFNSLFAENKKFVKDFIEFENGSASSKKTEFFYKEIAKSFIESLQQNIEFAYFDIRKFDKPLRNNDKEDDKTLVALFKLISPEHLLKLSFANDSNSLDKNFYAELLHIIGLTEVKDGGKKIITRHEPKNRNSGSLLENAITQLESVDVITHLKDAKKYGENLDEKLFNVALELSITWVNRILFLKLLEAQLKTYHKGDESYLFLNSKLIKDYDELNRLFFQVLAQKPELRNIDIAAIYAKVPYLNSSLFEGTSLEREAFFINSLEDNKNLNLLSNTVITDNNGKKKTGNLNSLDYFLSFLDAYNFASDENLNIQEDNKTLINASVLGLIFEKINGYKDGSFFTPSFITMYMCRETIRRAVVQKFNDIKGWNCTEFSELYNKIDDIREANDIVNKLKICDPAVGSGHFLVSALNEIIAIKNDLRILQDKNGKRIKEYNFEVINDELLISDDEIKSFQYDPKNKDSQRVQETLFHEKQTIIENCLFGVDINPNSVKICQLRLWIELLKNAYYRPNTNELETLPNIDINIKCGNSLISRFALDADLKKALKQSKWTIETYKLAVTTYQNAESKEQKREMTQLIEEIKTNFKSEIATNDPKKLKLEKLRGEMFNYTNQVGMFERSKKEQTEWNKRVNVLATDIKTLDVAIEEIKTNKIYDNAFEWRFEFPSVLDDDGDFIGFDVVIGNPPYMRIRDENIISKKYYSDNYKTAENQIDLYHLFIERCNQISSNSRISLIIPNTFLGNENNKKLRKYIIDNLPIEKIVDSRQKIFDDADVDVLMILTGQSEDEYFELFDNQIEYKHNFNSLLFKENENFNFTVTLNQSSQNIFSKIRENMVEVKSLLNVCSGIKEYQVGKGKPAQTQIDKDSRAFNSNIRIDDTYLRELRGKNINNYSINWNNEYISYGKWLAEPRDSEYFEGKRILIRKIPGAKNLIVSYTDEEFVIDQSIYIGKPLNSLVNLKFILGCLNSKITYWYFKNLYNEFDNLFPQIKTNEFKGLPIPKPNKEIESKIESKVNDILTLKKQDPKTDTSLQEQAIDLMVYELYCLTKEEIAIVESAN